MILLELFWVWFQIGLFSIGGGYAALPIIKNMVVDNYGLLTLAQFADLVVIAEMTPGPIIINSATFVGTQVAGFPGAVVATLGCITGPAIIVFIIAYFYSKYKELTIVKMILNVLRPAVVALIASAWLSIIVLTYWEGNGFSLDIHRIDFIAVGLSIVAFLIIKKFKINPVFIMLGCGLVGGIVYSII